MKKLCIAFMQISNATLHSIKQKVIHDISFTVIYLFLDALHLNK